MVWDYFLAVHGGLEYKSPQTPEELKLSLTNLRLGISYYFALPWLSTPVFSFTNLYLSPYVSYPLAVSLQNTFGETGEVEASLDTPEFSFGLSIGKEWYLSGNLVYGAGLSLGKDVFTLDYGNTLIQESSVVINFVSIFVSISYN